MKLSNARKVFDLIDARELIEAQIASAKGNPIRVNIRVASIISGLGDIEDQEMTDAIRVGVITELERRLKHNGEQLHQLGVTVED